MSKPVVRAAGFIIFRYVTIVQYTVQVDLVIRDFLSSLQEDNEI